MEMCETSYILNTFVFAESLHCMSSFFCFQFASVSNTVYLKCRKYYYQYVFYCHCLTIETKCLMPPVRAWCCYDIR